MGIINKFIFLSSSIFGLSTLLSCNQNINKRANIIKINNKRPISLLLENNREIGYSNFDSILLEENNPTSFITHNHKQNIKVALATYKIAKKWNRSAKYKLKVKKELEVTKTRKRALSITAKTVSSLLIMGGIIGVGVYLFKYNRDPLHKTSSFLLDLVIKTFLKIKKVDVDFEDSFRNLIFYIFKEKDSEDKKTY